MDLQQMIDPEDFTKLFKSDHVGEAKKLLSHPIKNFGKLEFCKARDYCGFMAMYRNIARAGNSLNMTVPEFKNAIVTQSEDC